MPILIRNLPRTLTESELEALFTPFGEVRTCDLVMDEKTSQSKGFGFVDMEDQESADKAIAKLNANVIEGVKIRVKWSSPERHQEPVREQYEPEKPSGDVQNAWNTNKE